MNYSGYYFSVGNYKKIQNLPINIFGYEVIAEMKSRQEQMIGQGYTNPIKVLVKIKKTFIYSLKKTYFAKQNYIRKYKKSQCL